ncbi:MAG: DUF5103 domain-containing protein [Sediminibacterium magnilacihabitans]|jgi:hypothetical protein|nr:DUF5103 domain-containing protein [Sediminibacterium magnilacihabitans]PQV61966.1 uncharacterized protein DUF5103 [Sediminibacterium magnilacihabitans]
MKKLLLVFLVWQGCFLLHAQRLPDHVYMPGIRTVKLFQQNNQQSLPVIRLNSPDLLELHFDDLDGYSKNYFYTLQLCNADWTPADLSPFDYINGFQQNRLYQYRMSSISTTPYVHYQALLPERNCIPTRSGNYLLKVFLNGDTSQLAFTKRLMVMEDKMSVGARILQPFDNALIQTHQKLQFFINTREMNVLNVQQQVKVVVLQNNRWDDAVTGIQPSFIRNNVLEYNGERDCVFAAGKEYRWADLQSFRFESDRVDHIDQRERPFAVYMKPDFQRQQLAYVFFTDRNGWDQISATESINPWWQSDYAQVKFTLAPANKQPLAGRRVYLLGECTGNQVSDTSLMQFDEANGVYTKTLLLKQGYYSYIYVTKSVKDPDERAATDLTEGNYWETENDYTILVYYRSLSGRHDELLGISTINSRTGRY